MTNVLCMPELNQLYVIMLTDMENGYEHENSELRRKILSRMVKRLKSCGMGMTGTR